MTLQGQGTGRPHRTGMVICSIALAVLGALGATGCEVGEMRPVSTAGPGVANANEAKLVFLRPSPESSIFNFPIVDESGNALALSAPESQTMIRVAPGVRQFTLVGPGSRDVLRADLAAGKTYYVLVSKRDVGGHGRWGFTALRGDQDWLALVQAAARSSSVLEPDDDVAVLDGTRGAMLDRDPVTDERSHTLRPEDGR